MRFCYMELAESDMQQTIKITLIPQHFDLTLFISS